MTPPPAQISVPRPPKLSVQLRAIAERCRSETVTVGELLRTLHGSPTLLLAALLCLPFLPPVSPPGLSIPFGIIIALFGLRLALGQKPIIPRKLLTAKIPQKILPSILAGASRVLQGLELLSAPRWPLLTQAPFLIQIYGAIILVSALLMMLPLPIPFANFLPALTILLFALALIERDGVLIVLGLTSFATTLGYFTFLVLTSKELVFYLFAQAP